MRDKIEKYLNDSIDKLYEKDKHLISNCPFDEIGKDDLHHVGERSIVFRLAHYLANFIENDNELKSYNLDCEYNRNGINTKKLPSFLNGTYPDIIIHKRGSHDDNLLVVEVKTYWNNDATQDKKKLGEFVDPTGGYRFRYGLSLVIKEKRCDTVLDWVQVYPEWTSIDKILIQAENFFENGGAFRLLKTLQADINAFKTTRNAIAHKSQKAQHDFENLVRGKVGHLPDNITPAKFVSEYKSGKRKADPTLFQYYVEFLKNSSTMLVEFKYDAGV